jgi:hypothetical protein
MTAIVFDGGRACPPNPLEIRPLVWTEWTAVGHVTGSNVTDPDDHAGLPPRSTSKIRGKLLCASETVCSFCRIVGKSRLGPGDRLSDVGGQHGFNADVVNQLASLNRRPLREDGIVEHIANDENMIIRGPLHCFGAAPVGICTFASAHGLLFPKRGRS